MTVLDEIIARRRESLEARRRELSLAEIQAALADLDDAPRDFATALRGPCVRVIAEIKFRSPSRGVLTARRDPGAIAAEYEAGGAAALSVLTEPDYFGGRPDYVNKARQATSLPALRKDFVVDEYQLYESRLLGADALLLIVSALSDMQLAEYLGVTRGLGMSALVETHNAEEIGRALASGARALGINNRDLRTMKVSLATTERLARLVPPDVVLVSESGILSPTDLERVAEAGANAVLVGTHLMQDPHPGQALLPLTQIPAKPRESATGK